MNHTYLYPLPASARFLWMLGRADTMDLFGFPDDTHKAGVLTTLRLDDELAQARNTVLRLINDAPRVCIGRGYTIPGSVVCRGDDVIHWSTKRLTQWFWDAPVLTPDLAARTIRDLDKCLDRSGNTLVAGRDPHDNIVKFLHSHADQPIIPVWM